MRGVSQPRIEAVTVHVVLRGWRPRRPAAVPGQRPRWHAAASAARRVHVDGAAVEVDACDGAAVDRNAAAGLEMVVLMCSTYL